MVTAGGHTQLLIRKTAAFLTVLVYNTSPSKISLTSPVAGIGEVSSEGVGLMRGLPHWRRAVVVVGVHVVIVNIHAS